MSLFQLHRHGPSVRPDDADPIPSATPAEVPMDRAQEFSAARQASDQFLWRVAGWTVALSLAIAAVIVLPSHPVVSGTLLVLGAVVLLASTAFRRFLRTAAADETHRLVTADEPTPSRHVTAA